MNTSTPAIDQAFQELARMNRVLAALSAKNPTMNRRQLALLAEGPLEEIRRIEALIAAWAGRSSIEEGQADVWLGIAGEDIAWPDAPTSVITSLLNSLRKGVQAAAEWMENHVLSTRPTKALKSACDLRISIVRTGSVRVGLRLPESAGTDESDEGVRAARMALETYLAAASWVGSDATEEQLTTAVPDVGLRRVLLTELKRLAPRPRGQVRTVALSGSVFVGREIVLTREVHRRIDAAIDATASERTETYTGDLREIDLDRCQFTLRNVAWSFGRGDGPFEVPCEFEQELLETALTALDRRVEVSGVRRNEGSRRSRSTLLRVIRLVIVDDSEPARPTEPGGGVVP